MAKIVGHTVTVNIQKLVASNARLVDFVGKARQELIEDILSEAFENDNLVVELESVSGPYEVITDPVKS